MIQENRFLKKRNGVCWDLVAEESLACCGRESPLFSFPLMLVTLVMAPLPSGLSACDLASYFLQKAERIRRGFSKLLSPQLCTCPRILCLLLSLVYEVSGNLVKPPPSVHKILLSVSSGLLHYSTDAPLCIIIFFFCLARSFPSTY